MAGPDQEVPGIVLHAASPAPPAPPTDAGVGVGVAEADPDLEVRYEEDDRFFSAQDVRIHCKYWRPPAERLTRAFVFLCHSLAEHLGYYDELARHLAESGFFVYGHDHYGHGKSEGERCYVKVNFYDTFVTTVLEHCMEIRRRHPGLRHFIYGHSVGGMIAVRAALRNKALFSGMILETPQIRVQSEPNNSSLWHLVAMTLDWLLPGATLGTGVLPEFISNVQEVQRRIDKDPLYYKGGIKFRTLKAIYDSEKIILDQMSDIDLPLLMFSSSADPMVPLNSMEEFYRKSSTPEEFKDLVVLVGCSHHLILDQRFREKLFRSCVERLNHWLDRDLTLRRPYRA